MRGRRLPVMLDPGGFPDLSRSLPLDPGDYVGPFRGYTGGRDALFFMLPVGRDDPAFGIRHVTSPPHSFIENEDGSLTVSEQIAASGWSGFLTEGRWMRI